MEHRLTSEAEGVSAEAVLNSASEANPLCERRDVSLLSAAERQKILVEWNDTGTGFPVSQCVHQLVEDQVARTPEAIAVVFEDDAISYAELNRRANELAHHLRKLGVKPDARVAVCVERSFEMIVALLAVLKAGGAYVPLDPAYPVERLRFVLEDAQPVALLTQSHLRDMLSGSIGSLTVLDLVTDAPAWNSEPHTNLDGDDVGINPSHLAYIIYTSGSTGQPKGVMVEHANVMRLFTATDQWFGFGADDVWTLFHSYAFDFSVWEIWGALLYGGRLVVVPKDIVRSPSDFYQLLCRQNVTVLNQTPSAFRQLIAAQAGRPDSHRLRYIVFGGEALEVSSLKPWYEQNRGQSTKLINMYGITETTVHVTYRPLEEADTERYGASPIGCRIPDLRIYILDAEGQPVPVGLEGELYVGGAGVARGYLNRPELTAQRFLPDPFADESGARMYRTGDLARWIGDGEMEYLGRNDFQVKIRGFRIELGEIEARLSNHPAVREAIVIAREDTPGDKKLVAYYTSAGEEDAVGAEQFRSHLSATLPDYMVPAAYVRMEALPLTLNGKLDRKALPAPDADAYLSHGDELPIGEMEQKIAAIWQEVLGIAKVGRDDNFFDLGGDSLLLLKIHVELQEAFSREIPVVDMFRYTTVRAITQNLIGDSESNASESDRFDGKARRDALQRRRKLRQKFTDELVRGQS